MNKNKGKENMKKLIMISIICITFLTGCEPSTTDSTSEYKLPEGLSDCRIYELDGSDGNRLYALRCPLSESLVTYRNGKIVCHTITVERDTNGIGEYNRLKAKFEK